MHPPPDPEPNPPPGRAAGAYSDCPAARVAPPAPPPYSPPPVQPPYTGPRAIVPPPAFACHCSPHAARDDGSTHRRVLPPGSSRCFRDLPPLPLRPSSSAAVTFLLSRHGLLPSRASPDRRLDALSPTGDPPLSSLSSLHRRPESHPRHPALPRSSSPPFLGSSRRPWSPGAGSLPPQSH